MRNIVTPYSLWNIVDPEEGGIISSKLNPQIITLL
jgi:hypothetical protein